MLRQHLFNVCLKAAIFWSVIDHSDQAGNRVFYINWSVIRSDCSQAVYRATVSCCVVNQNCVQLLSDNLDPPCHLRLNKKYRHYIWLDGSTTGWQKLTLFWQVVVTGYFQLHTSQSVSRPVSWLEVCSLNKADLQSLDFYFVLSSNERLVWDETFRYRIYKLRSRSSSYSVLVNECTVKPDFH